ncbi:MAG: 50S ribosomal protein L11 methyltransferase [Saprospiraceae bacterium]
MDYYKFQINAAASDIEVLIALFSLQPFDTFQEREGGFDAFLPATAWDENLETWLREFQHERGFTCHREFVPGQNWNVIWESNFQPVIVGSFCAIRASFHPPIPSVRHELVITPKMAFGTGHHETTFMVVELMEQLDFTGKSVLDYGCGTGVLGILASRLGASKIDAVDIEIQSFENARENCQVNHVENMEVFHGTLNAVPPANYGVVLANINRNVILDSLPALSSIVVPEGTLVISGFVGEDGPLMKGALQQHAFQHVETKAKGNWLAMVARKQA